MSEPLQVPAGPPAVLTEEAAGATRRLLLAS
jgi:hypothetical protein